MVNSLLLEIFLEYCIPQKGVQRFQFHFAHCMQVQMLHLNRIKELNRMHSNLSTGKLSTRNGNRIIIWDKQILIYPIYSSSKKN